MEENSIALSTGGANFLTESSIFGTEQSPGVNNEALADLIFDGGSPSASPEQVAQIPEKEKQPKKKVEEQVVTTSPEDTSKEPLGKEVTADDIFGTPSIPEEITETEDESIPDTIADTDTPEENTYTTLAEHLFEYNIFTKGEDETPIVTGQDLKERWEKEKQLQVQNQIYGFLQSKHGEEGINMFNDVFVNGADPKEYISKYVQIQNVKDLDLTLEDNQEKVYKEYYRRSGWAEDKITKYLEKDKNYGDLEEKAKDFHEILVEQEEEELVELAEQAKVQQAQRIQGENFYKQKVSEIISDKLKSREFDGIPVTEKVAKEALVYLSDKKYQLPNGELLTEFDKDILELRKPENYELKVKIALLLKDKGDLSKIKTKAISQNNDELFNKVARTGIKTKSNNIPKKSNQDDFFNRL